MSEKETKLPNIDEVDEIEIIDESEEDSSKKSKKSLVLLGVTFLLVILLGGAAGIYKLVSSDLSEDSLPVIQEHELANPADIVRPDPLPLPTESANDEPLPSAIEVIPTESAETKVEMIGDSDITETEQESIDSNYQVDFENIDQRLDQISLHITQLVERVGELEESHQSAMAKNQIDDKALNQLKSEMHRLSRKFDRLSTQTHARSNNTPKSSQKPQQADPAAPLSFAIWNGRDAVMIEHPVGKIRLLYVGDVVNDWRVVKISSNSVTYQSLLNQKKRTLKLGE